MTVSVPRARLEMLFRAADADLIVLSTRSPERDLCGTFVPVFKYRALLVGIKPVDPAVQSVDALLSQTDLRIAVVRGFDYGPAYRKLLEPAMAARVQYANDLKRRGVPGEEALPLGHRQVEIVVLVDDLERGLVRLLGVDALLGAGAG